MARIDDMNANLFKEFLRRLRALETASPLGSSSINRGALRIASIEGLIVEGSARVTGLFKGVGTFLWENIFNVTGTATFTGTTNMDGPVDIDGNVALKGDMNVSGGGKIVVAGSVPMTLGVTSDGRPGAEFAGGRMTSDGTRIALTSGGAVVGAAPTFASLSIGSTAIIAKSDGPYLMNLPTTSNPANLYVHTDGKLYRSDAGGSPV